MRDDSLLGLHDRLGPCQRDQKVTGLQIHDTAEAADEMSALDLEPPEGKVRKIGVKRGLSLARQEAAARGKVSRLFRDPGEGQARALQRIAARGSFARLRVCRARVEIRNIGEPPGSVASVMSEA